MNQTFNELSKHPKMMELLEIVESLHLNQACICAGTIRNNIWNLLSNKEVTFDTDVDVVFYDPNISWEKTMEIETTLKNNYPKYKWELRNQVYMHEMNKGTEPFISVEDALSKFPETCTAIGMYKEGKEVKIVDPLGIHDLMNFIVTPTPHFLNNKERMKIFKQRLQDKGWSKRWDEIAVVMEENFEVAEKCAGDLLTQHTINNNKPTDKSECAYSIKKNGEIIGAITAKQFVDELHVSLLAVDNNYRGSGYGQVLLRKCEEYAVSVGCKIITLTTLSFHAPEFYKKNGYTVFTTLEDVPIKGVTRYYLYKKVEG